MEVLSSITLLKPVNQNNSQKKISKDDNYSDFSVSLKKESSQKNNVSTKKSQVVKKNESIHGNPNDKVEQNMTHNEYKNIKQVDNKTNDCEQQKLKNNDNLVNEDVEEDVKFDVNSKDEAKELINTLIISIMNSTNTSDKMQSILTQIPSDFEMDSELSATLQSIIDILSTQNTTDDNSKIILSDSINNIQKQIVNIIDLLEKNSIIPKDMTMHIKNKLDNITKELFDSNSNNETLIKEANAYSENKPLEVNVDVLNSSDKKNQQFIMRQKDIETDNEEITEKTEEILINSNQLNTKVKMSIGRTIEFDKPQHNITNNIDTTNILGTDNVLIKDINSIVSQVNKVDKPLQYSKAEIINQIIEKAEVSISKDISSMELQLKPESLGKLTLKIAVENGLITAKFIAQSEQVKSIIESSFNELRDMLQQKGVAVQSMSVSVGQEQNNFGSNQSFEAWKRAMKTNTQHFGFNNIEETLMDYDTSIVVNPYEYYDGSVDFRA